jgi:hypothetical protein
VNDIWYDGIKCRGKWGNSNKNPVQIYLLQFHTDRSDFAATLAYPLRTLSVRRVSGACVAKMLSFSSNILVSHSCWTTAMAWNISIEFLGWPLTARLQTCYRHTSSLDNLLFYSNGMLTFSIHLHSVLLINPHNTKNTWYATVLNPHSLCPFIMLMPKSHFTIKQQFYQLFVEQGHEAVNVKILRNTIIHLYTPFLCTF